MFSFGNIEPDFYAGSEVVLATLANNELKTLESSQTIKFGIESSEF